MENTYTLHSWGIGKPDAGWLAYINYRFLCDRIYYIIKEGAGYIHKNKTYYFKKNHFYLLPGRCNLCFFVDDPDFTHFYIDYTNPSLLNYDHIISFELDEQPLIKHDIDTFLCFIKEKNAPAASPTRFANEFYTHKKRVLALIDGLFYDILDAFPDAKAIDPTILKAINYIQQNFINEISIPDLAKYVNLSKSQLTRNFHTITGVSPYQYIKNYRFDIALDMLANGYSISETAERCGFLSVAAFSNSFKKHFGKPPTKMKSE